MQKLNRNGKEQQRQLQNAQLEAEQFINELRQMLAPHGKNRLSVGQMVNAAAASGFLHPVPTRTRAAV